MNMRSWLTLLVTISCWHMVACSGSEGPSAVDALVIKAKKDDAQVSEGTRKVVQTDIDGDGDSDEVVLFTLEGRGGGNSDETYLAVLKNDGETVSSIGPFSLGKLLEWGVNIDTAKIEGASLVLDFFAYEENDPRCCPSTKGKITYAWEENKFVPLKRDIEIDGSAQAQSSAPSSVNSPEAGLTQAPASELGSDESGVSLRGLHLGMSAETILANGLADGGVRAFPPAMDRDVGDEVMKLFRLSTPDCASDFNARVASWSEELATKQISCDFVGQLILDKSSRVRMANLYLAYFEADPRTTDQQFLEGLSSAYDIETFEFVGRTDDSMMLGRGAVTLTWVGQAATGETFRVTKRGWPLGLMVSVEQVKTAKY